MIMTQSEKEKFTQTAALTVLSKLLDKTELLSQEYRERDSSMAHMNIYEFAADVAVEYANALTKRLSE